MNRKTDSWRNQTTGEPLVATFDPRERCGLCRSRDRVLHRNIKQGGDHDWTPRRPGA